MRLHGSRNALTAKALFLILAQCGPAAMAQVAPDAGALLRDSRQSPTPEPVLPEIPTPKVLKDTGIQTVIRHIEVKGSSRFEPARLDGLFTDLIGQKLGFAQMQAAADRVATLYRQSGMHAATYLPEQSLADGLLQIVVIEGRFGAVRIEKGEGAERLPLARIERMLMRGQVHGEMLDANALERQTLLANELPGVRVSSVLAAGTQPGETDVIAKVDARPRISGSLSADNEDARASGADKLGGSLSLAEITGIGDSAQLLATLTEGKKYVRAAYDVPLNDAGLRASVNASTMRYSLIGEFAASGARGTANTAGAELRYPIVRSVERNLYGSADFDHRHLRNESVAGNLSDKTADVLTLGVNGDMSDERGGGGATLGGVALALGRINLDGNADDLAADQAGLRRNGGFAKLTANLARLQRLTATGALWLSFNGQLANKNLDSGEQFSLGGANGVRAYPALEGSGDEGFVLSTEYRHHATDALQLKAFYDYGLIRRVKNPLTNSPTPNSYALQGLGLGAEMQVRRATLRGALAWRVGHNPAADRDGKDSDGSLRSPRLWLDASLPF